VAISLEFSAVCHLVSFSLRFSLLSLCDSQKPWYSEPVLVELLARWLCRRECHEALHANVMSVKLCILIVRLPRLRFFLAFSSVVRQLPAYNPPRRGTARPLLKLIVSFCVLFVCKCVLSACKCVLYCCHRVATQLQLTNTSVSLTFISRLNALDYTNLRS